MISDLMLCLPDVTQRNGTILRSACCMYMSLMEYWQAGEEELLSESRTHARGCVFRSASGTLLGAKSPLDRKSHLAWSRSLITVLRISKVATIVRCSVPLYFNLKNFFSNADSRTAQTSIPQSDSGFLRGKKLSVRIVVCDNCTLCIHCCFTWV